MFYNKKTKYLEDYIMTVVAVIGCGRISDMAHFPALSQMDNVRIKYACDVLLEKAEEKKAKFPNWKPCLI